MSRTLAAHCADLLHSAALLHYLYLCMEQPRAPSEQPRRIEPNKLDLSDRIPDEPATVEDLETLRNEINYKLALLLNLQIKTIEDAPTIREQLTWKDKIDLASDIGYQNFLDHVLWRHAKKRTKDSSPRHKPDQGAW